jgi:teichuronic acid biosynthesis glycosyltransferase TuaH
MTHKSFVIFGGAELPWIYPLGVELARFGRVTLIRLGAKGWLNPRTLSWPFDDQSPNLERTIWTFPPGFNGRLSALFDAAIVRRFDRLVSNIAASNGGLPYIVMPESAFERYAVHAAPRKLVYLNYDDHAKYGTGRVRVEDASEAALIRRAGTVLCSSRFQRDAIKMRHPLKADAVFHFPHGVHESFVHPAPHNAPAARSVCIVGAMTARYDWVLIEAVIARMPSVEFIFAGDFPVGGIDDKAQEEWHVRLKRVLAYANVRHVRGLRHRETPEIYWNAAANWMPYDSTLPFVQACCPLKLTDGLASGRPVISADVPEARLYPDWIRVHRNADEAVALITNALDGAATELARDKRVAQTKFARENTWSSRARDLIGILDRNEHSQSRSAEHLAAS